MSGNTDSRGPLQKLKDALTPGKGSSSTDTYGNTGTTGTYGTTGTTGATGLTSSDPSFDAAPRGTQSYDQTGYQTGSRDTYNTTQSTTGAGYGTTDTGYGTTGIQEKKPITQKIAEAIPGTEANKEAKHAKGELTGAERREMEREGTGYGQSGYNTTTPGSTPYGTSGTTGYGTTGVQGQKPVTQKLAEAIPGTEANREAKHTRGELTTAERREMERGTTGYGTSATTGYGTSGTTGYDGTRGTGYDSTRDTGYGTTGVQGQKPITQKIAEVIPGTEANREAKHAQGELTSAERREMERGTTGYGTSGYSSTTTTQGTTGYGASGTTGYGTTGIQENKPITQKIAEYIPGTEANREAKLAQGDLTGARGMRREGSSSSSDSDDVHMRTARHSPNVHTEKFKTRDGLEGEVVTKTEQMVRVPEAHRQRTETVEVCGTQTFTEIEDRPIVTERVIREVTHRPVEKQFEVITRAVGERELTQKTETLDIHERVVDEVKGQKCPTTVPGMHHNPQVFERPVGSGVGGMVGAQQGQGGIASHIPGTDAYTMRKHAEGELTTGERMTQRTQAPAGYSERTI